MYNKLIVLKTITTATCNGEGYMASSSRIGTYIVMQLTQEKVDLLALYDLRGLSLTHRSIFVCMCVARASVTVHVKRSNLTVLT